MGPPDQKVTSHFISSHSYVVTAETWEMRELLSQSSRAGQCQCVPASEKIMNEPRGCDVKTKSVDLAHWLWGRLPTVVISYQIQANRLQKKNNTKPEVWEKFLSQLKFISQFWTGLVWLEIYIFCDILTLLRKFRNYSMKLDGKTNWWLRAGRERTGSQAPAPAPVNTKLYLGEKRGEEL